MRVAKLGTGQIVLYLRDATVPSFATYPHVLVSDRITTNPRRINPYWVPATLVVWVLDFGA